MIIVDGITGDVIIDPTEDELIAYQNKRERFFEDKRITKLRDADTVTVDGVHAELAANIGTPNDLPGVIENGAQGIGLYRRIPIWEETKCQQKKSNLKLIKSIRNNGR